MRRATVYQIWFSVKVVTLIVAFGVLTKTRLSLVNAHYDNEAVCYDCLLQAQDSSRAFEWTRCYADYGYLINADPHHNTTQTGIPLYGNLSRAALFLGDNSSYVMDFNMLTYGPVLVLVLLALLAPGCAFGVCVEEDAFAALYAVANALAVPMIVYYSDKLYLLRLTDDCFVSRAPWTWLEATGLCVYLFGSALVAFGAGGAGSARCASDCHNCPDACKCVFAVTVVLIVVMLVGPIIAFLILVVMVAGAIVAAGNVTPIAFYLVAASHVIEAVLLFRSRNNNYWKAEAGAGDGEGEGEGEGEAQSPSAVAGEDGGDVLPTTSSTGHTQLLDD